MEKAQKQLPDEVDLLKSLLAEQAIKLDQAATQKRQLLARNEQLSNQNQHYKAQVLTLQEQLHLAIARRYAASSEKISPDQYLLFDEAETDSEIEWEDD